MTESTASPAPSRRPWFWLPVIAVVGLIGATWIWSMRRADQICTLQFPVPPGCGPAGAEAVPIFTVALIVAGFTVAAIAWFLAPPRRLTLILVIVAASIVAVTLVSAMLMALSSGGGYWAPMVID